MTKKNVLVVISSLVILFLLGCPQQKKIGQINQDPQRYVNKDIAVKGTVVNSFSALVTGAYEIDDGTGRLWVLSNGGVPAKGSRIGVRGFWVTVTRHWQGNPRAFVNYLISVGLAATDPMPQNGAFEKERAVLRVRALAGDSDRLRRFWRPPALPADLDLDPPF